jgi:pimeloyl-ACP methyl ester carboxylesterase
MWVDDLAQLLDRNAPVHLWQGDGDFMVPHAHYYWLASKITRTEMNFIPENGHISLIVKHRQEIVRQLRCLIA